MRPHVANCGVQRPTASVYFKDDTDIAPPYIDNVKNLPLREFTNKVTTLTGRNTVVKHVHNQFRNDQDVNMNTIFVIQEYVQQGVQHPTGRRKD